MITTILIAAACAMGAEHPLLAVATPATRTSSVVRLLTISERDIYKLEQDAAATAKKCLASLKRCNGDLEDLRGGEQKFTQTAIAEASAAGASSSEPSTGWSPWVTILVGAVLAGAGATGCALLHCRL